VTDPGHHIVVNAAASAHATDVAPDRPSAPYARTNTPLAAAPNTAPVIVNVNRSRSTVCPGNARERSNSGIAATLAPAL
jgi:hypothetical protein